MAMVLDSETDLSFPYWTSVRRRFGPDSSFFATGNLERELLARQVALDLAEDEKHQLQKMLDQDTSKSCLRLCCVRVPCGRLWFEVQQLQKSIKKARSSKKQRQKKHRKQALHGKGEPSRMMEVGDETINGLVSAVPKLSTSYSSPSTVSFGRHHSRGLTFVPQAIQREKRPDSTAAQTGR
ncbi:hypothetical protein SLA2020_419680 [Shorea laevis]